MVEYKFEAYSIAGTTIMIAGLLRLYIYYKCFSISILPFLDPGEIITFFFDNLFYFLIFWCLNIIVIWMFYTIKDDKSIITTTNSFIKRLGFSGFFKLNKVILFLILSVVLFFISKARDSKSFYELYLWIALLVTAIYINPMVLLGSIHLLLKNNKVVNKMNIILLISAMNLFLFASLSGLNESFKVKNKQFYVGTKFELDNNQEIISTLDYYYIGKTKQFALFYDRVKQETDIIPVSKFTKMKYFKTR